MVTIKGNSGHTSTSHCGRIREFNILRIIKTKYINEDLLSLHSIQSTTVKALNICALNYELWEFSFTGEKLRAIMNKSKFKIKRMRRKEKSLVFKTKDT